MTDAEMTRAVAERIMGMAPKWRVYNPIYYYRNLLGKERYHYFDSEEEALATVNLAVAEHNTYAPERNHVRVKDFRIGPHVTFRPLTNDAHCAQVLDKMAADGWHYVIKSPDRLIEWPGPNARLTMSVRFFRHENGVSPKGKACTTIIEGIGESDLPSKPPYILGPIRRLAIVKAALKAVGVEVEG